MTKRDYDRMVEILAATYGKQVQEGMGGYFGAHAIRGTIWAVAEEFALRAEADNPRFNRERFFETLGIHLTRHD
jgi:hypothetical protein